MVNYSKHMSEIADEDVRILALFGAERRRQVAEEGYDFDHDDAHDQGELAQAAAAYCIAHSAIAPQRAKAAARNSWPWRKADHSVSDTFKPSEDAERDLIKAGALILAEIGRIRRARS